MDVTSLLKTINDSFSIIREIEFKEFNLKFELGPLITEDEIKVLESSKGVEDTNYINTLKNCSLALSIKKINDMDFSRDEITFVNDKGITESQSRFIFLTNLVNKWPSTLRDVLFDAFQNLQAEQEEKIRKNAKYERFILSPEKEVENTPSGFKKVNKIDDEKDLTEVEKLNKRVDISEKWAVQETTATVNKK